MKPSLADQLKGVKIASTTYGKIPMREDVLILNPPASPATKALLFQWEKLQHLQNNLKTIDRYIQSKSTDTLASWLNVNKLGIAKRVLEKIGGYNNATGGISAYFLNLQNFYDQEETKYDQMEAQSAVPSELQTIVADMCESRANKRDERRAFRKAKTKDLKKDGKGYLEVVMEEPTAQPTAKTLSADAAVAQKVADAGAVIAQQKNNIGIWIAGVTLFVAAVYIYNKSGE